MSYWKQAILSLLVVAAAAAGWFLYEREGAGEPPGQVADGGSREGGAPREAGGRETSIPGLIGGGAVNVVTAPVEVDAAGASVIALGTAKAAHSVTLYPQVAGIVSEILFKPGEAVAANAPLLRLNAEEEQANLDRARIEFAQAEAALERSRSLAESKTISSVALSDAEMATQLAGTQVRLAEIALSRRTVSAPFAGVVGLSDISIGDLIGSTTAITTLDDLSTVRVGFEVPERWSASIREGMPIAAIAQALPGSEFKGKITGIDNHVDQTTRTLKLEAELTNFGRVLKAGMAITVRLTFDTEADLAVPSLAVQWDRRGSFVWKVVEGAARRADVAIVRRHSGIVVVRGDVGAGDHVVVEGLLRLRDGAKVNEVDETPTIVETPAATSDGKGEEAAPAASAEPAASTRS
jgi:RND family efflux transporter MFP subunit